MIAVLRTVIAYVILSIGCFLMLCSIANYATFQDNVQFLIYKQAYLNNNIWKMAFYIHVFSAIIALLAGLTQFSSSFMQDHRSLHRLIGKIYVVDILFINFPAALIMAIYANGGIPGKVAFLLLDFLWCYFTYNAYVAIARHKDINRHKNFMLRSYALTFSAITLRMWKVILTCGFVLSFDQRYVMEAWLGFIPNLIIAEAIIYWKFLIVPRKAPNKTE